MNIKTLTNRSLISFLVMISCAVSIVLSQEKNSRPVQRPLAAADLSRFEQIGDYNVPFSFSPDGKYLAFVVVRAKAAAAQTKHYGVFDEERSDIWLAPVSGEKPRNLTNGAGDGSGNFMPSWSPDGNRLAMISTKGGGFRLWVWDKASGETRALTEENINYWFSDEPSIVWISNEQIVCSVLPKGQRPRRIEQRKVAAETAMREWSKYWSGQEPTASVIESGIPVKFANRPQGQLLLLNAVTGKKKVVATGTFRLIKISPDKQHIAVLKQTSIFRPEPDRSLALRSFRRFASLGYQVMIANTSGEIIAPQLDEVDNVHTIAWARNSRELAIVGEQRDNPDSNLKTFIYDLAKRSVRTAVVNTAERSGLQWLSNSQLLVRAGQQENDKKPTEINRSDWWLTSANEAPRNLTVEMKSVPSEMLEGPAGTFVGITGGSLWEIGTNGASPKKISLGLDSQMRSIDRFTTEQGKLPRLVVETGPGPFTRYHLIDLTSNRSFEIAKPDTAARLVDFNFNSNAAAMTANTRNGTYLWLVQPQTPKPRSLLVSATNTFLRDIAEVVRKLIEYRSQDGRLLKGWLILPVNYQDGKKYPLVTWVYPGLIYGDFSSEGPSINYPLPGILHLLSGHGYAVLLPSIPMDMVRPGREAYMEIANGALPAVDKIIEMGIADPARLGIMGHSYGGYATFCLITQTNKFRAAVVLAGMADYASYYGEFILNKRYTDTPLDFPRTMYDIEATGSIHLGLGKPPWKNMELYLRNSPLSYVEKVETPVMIIHGDMDVAVPIEQAEQFFSALYRQNKRAQFVRYWGEGHALESPANICDMWQRIYAWFDELLTPTQ